MNDLFFFNENKRENDKSQVADISIVTYFLKWWKSMYVLIYFDYDTRNTQKAMEVFTLGC